MLQVSTTEEAPDNSPEANERALIRRIRDGESSLFAQLIKPYERRVYVTALALLRNPADAEDAAQEAILKAFTHLGQFRGAARFSTWLIQITINEARMRQRRRHADLFEPIGEFQDEQGTYTPREFADWREIPSEELERGELRSLLTKALDSLGQIYREVFVLRDIEQFSIEETAQALGISIASVKTRLLRARLMLRDILSRSFVDGRLSGPAFQKGNKPW
jgi:RNA polymerase sigma-70 factor, ECF subfamily